MVPGGVPGASWCTLWGQVGLQVAFSMVFGGPGDPFGLLWGCFGRPGSHFGTKSRHQGEKKTGFGAHWDPESIFAPKSEGPAPV